jgi:GT2 family glycosyltransferase
LEQRANALTAARRRKRSGRRFELSLYPGAPLALDGNVSGAVAGWVLVEARLGRQRPYATARLALRGSATGERALDVLLPVTTAGKVSEVVNVPSGVNEVIWHPPRCPGPSDCVLNVRNIGWLERQARMRWRIFWISAGMPWKVRRLANLTVLRALRDAPGVYRDIAAFRTQGARPDYATWVRCFDTLSDDDCRMIAADIAQFRVRPRIRVVVLEKPAGKESARAATIASLRAQIYPNHEHVLLDISTVPGGSALGNLNRSLDEAGANDWLMVLHAGEVLPPHALYCFAREALDSPNSAVIYADDDQVDFTGERLEPRFKPDWSPLYFSSDDYIGSAAMFRSGSVARAGGLTRECCTYGTYDVFLRVLDLDGGGAKVAHIRAVLLHRDSSDTADVAALDWRKRALEAHYKRCGVAATIEGAPRGLRTRFQSSSTPMVSIIVPTRDALPLLKRCVESVLRATHYPNYELLVVDNRSTADAVLDYLSTLTRHAGVRVLRVPGRFNFSAINNFAANQAAGSLLCLLNNDTQAISSDWLEEMVGHALQPDVGAVGAKLLYPDGTVQHGGVALCPNWAHHLHVGLRSDDPGYCGLAVVTHECSAVTAACMVTHKHLYESVGGLNERWLPVTFNDVDYCLRIRQAGYRVVFAAHAHLYHDESATRGADSSSLLKELRAYREFQYLRLRWRRQLAEDPYYNPNLSYRTPDFSFSEAMRVTKPWRLGVAPGSSHRAYAEPGCK